MIVHENEIKNPVEIETKTDFKSDLKQDINSENQFECEEDYVAKIEEKNVKSRREIRKKRNNSTHHLKQNFRRLKLYLVKFIYR